MIYDSLYGDVSFKHWAAVVLIEISINDKEVNKERWKIPDLFSSGEPAVSEYEDQEDDKEPDMVTLGEDKILKEKACLVNIAAQGADIDNNNEAIWCL